MRTCVTAAPVRCAGPRPRARRRSGTSATCSSSSPPSGTSCAARRGVAVSRSWATSRSTQPTTAPMSGFTGSGSVSTSEVIRSRSRGCLPITSATRANCGATRCIAGNRYAIRDSRGGSRAFGPPLRGWTGRGWTISAPSPPTGKWTPPPTRRSRAAGRAVPGSPCSRLCVASWAIYPWWPRTWGRSIRRSSRYGSRPGCRGCGFCSSRSSTPRASTGPSVTRPIAWSTPRPTITTRRGDGSTVSPTRRDDGCATRWRPTRPTSSGA